MKHCNIANGGKN